MKVIHRLCLLFVASILGQGFGGEGKTAARVELSYAQTSGNTKTENISVNFNVEGQFQKNKCIARGGYLMAKTNQTESADKFNAEIRYERVFTSRVFGFIESTYLRDRFSGYEYRFSTGPGLGFVVIQKEKHKLNTLLSGRYDFEKGSMGASETSSYTSVKLAGEYIGKIKEHVTLKGKADYLTSVEDMGKYYIDAETALEIALSDRLSIGLRYLVNYQNQVPALGIKKTDTAFLTSLIVNL
jgi:putative salt-induced outer membrane protein